jgi:hypothetical protein
MITIIIHTLTIVKQTNMAPTGTEWMGLGTNWCRILLIYFFSGDLGTKRYRDLSNGTKWCRVI